MSRALSAAHVFGVDVPVTFTRFFQEFVDTSLL